MSTTPEKTVIEFATGSAHAGLSVVTIRADGSKRPIGAWKQYMKRIAGDDEIRKMFGSNGAAGVGIVAGKVSGGLEIIDFDRVGLFEQFADRVEQKQPGLIDRLTRVRTPRMGTHLLYRCEQIEGNQKLAQEPVTDEETGKLKPEVMIETRGEGGLVVAEGSPPECHPTGNLYRRFAGPDLTEIPTISVEERDVLLQAARSFNLWREPVETSAKPGATVPKCSGITPGDAYAAKTSWEEILEPHGWTQVGFSGDKVEWRRPGKKQGMSATSYISNDSGGRFFRVSATTPFHSPGRGTASRVRRIPSLGLTRRCIMVAITQRRARHWRAKDSESNGAEVAGPRRRLPGKPTARGSLPTVRSAKAAPNLASPTSSCRRRRTRTARRRTLNGLWTCGSCSASSKAQRTTGRDGSGAQCSSMPTTPLLGSKPPMQCSAGLDQQWELPGGPRPSAASPRANCSPS
ncbi:MAG: bifunctional DNA primase/polymerase [Planctomycetes bacterium]|nr:bifunctional DNA primase/polymerase [Planctomycetota bacterium]